MFMASGTYSTNRLIIRGIGSRTPYSTNRIRAYFGDVPLTSGDGTTTIEDIDAADIGRIEVIRGPASAIYGSGLGGIVRIFPEYPDRHGLHSLLNTETGSFGALRNIVKTGFNNGRFSAGACFSNTKSEGFRQNSRYSRNSLFVTSNLSSAKSNLSILLTYSDIAAQIPSSLDENTFRTHPEKAAGNWLAIKGNEKDRRLLAGLTFQHFFTRHLSNKLTLFSSLSRHDESRPFNILADHAFSAGFREMVEWRPGTARVHAGAEVYSENYNWQIFQTLAGTKGDLQNDNAENRSYINSFVHASHPLSQKLRAEAGLNFNILRYILRDRFDAGHPPAQSYTYKPVFSPYAGLNFQLTHAIFIYASAGHGFSAPSLEETLLPAGNINPDLKPEQGWNDELGSRGQILSGRLYYDLCLYNIHVSNLLVTRRLTEDTFMGINAGKTEHYGLEAWLKLNILASSDTVTRSLSVSSSLTLSKNRFLSFTDNGTDYSGKTLPGIPSAVLNFDLSYKSPFGLRVFTGIHFTGGQYMNDLNSLRYGPYHTARLKLEWDFPRVSGFRNIGVYAGVQNLFNEKYASMILVNAPAFGTSPPRYFYPGEPRNFYAGVRFRI